MKIAEIQGELIAPDAPDRLRVTVRSESGLTGAAEADLPGRARSVVNAVSEHVKDLIGSDPFHTEALVDRLLTRAPGRAGDVEATAVSLLEIACHDLIARSLGVSISQWFGGPVRDRIPACAVSWLPANCTQDAAYQAARAVTALGFRTLAFEPFGPGWTPLEPAPSAFRQAVRLAETVRAAVGTEVSLRVDLNGRLNAPTAIRFLRALERIEPVEVADPIPAENLPLEVGLPVSAGHRLNLRREFFPLLSRRGCDSIRLDLSRSGGFIEAKKIASLAELHGASVSFRYSRSPLATAACLNLAATLTNLAYVEIAFDPSLQLAPLSEGLLSLPPGPGQGENSADSSITLSQEPGGFPSPG